MRIAAGQVLAKLSHDTHPVAPSAWGKRFKALLIAISDGVDGYLARARNQITKLGAFLDPIADKMLMISACLLLASQRGHVRDFLLPPTVVVLFGHGAVAANDDPPQCPGGAKLAHDPGGDDLADHTAELVR